MARSTLAAAVRWAGMAVLVGTTAARADVPDLYTALRDEDCAAAGKAVNAGIERADPQAYFFAGYLYEATGCVADDPARAARFYQRAVELGHVEARNALGRLHGVGRGVPQDYVAAYRWFTAGPTGAADPTASDVARARIAGYAMTVTQVARTKTLYPLLQQRDGIESTLETVFDPVSGAVAFTRARASIEVGSNVGKTGPFADAITRAYDEARAGLVKPDGLSQSTLRIGTTWQFAMRHGRQDEKLKGEGAISLEPMRVVGER